jgi:hypothetical protein
MERCRGILNIRSPLSKDGHGVVDENGWDDLEKILTEIIQAEDQLKYCC